MGLRARATTALAVVLAAWVASSAAQTFQRLGACPTLGCIFPPDQVDFLAGQHFDIRLEVHAPVNGSSGSADAKADENFKFTIQKSGSSDSARDAKDFFGVNEPELEKWDFQWYEDLFAKDANKPSVVKVASKAYRKVCLKDPGEYVARLTYNNGEKSEVNWLVRESSATSKAKNVIMFIGDGMTTNMITAARLIAHKTVNGRYQSKMMLDQFPVLGHQMTHSLDSFITDSANSATALYTGHKTTVNALGVYADSSKNPFDDPKIETIAEIFQRAGGHIGIVSTAAVSDATPAALAAHTRDRTQYAAIVDQHLNGNTNYSWVDWKGPDVLFGGGADQFFNSQHGGISYKDQDYYEEFSKKGYQVVKDKNELDSAKNDARTLGIFSVSHMSKWLDRNVYTDSLKNQKNSPDGSKGDALNQPGLKDMTLKAIDILQERSKDGKGWFIMSEAASIDKMMHVLDYDRALGELLELDDTVKATVEKLRAMKILDDTLVLVTADHGHGFDVMGSVDTKYLSAQKDDRSKRNAVGVYQNAGLSEYTQTGDLHYSEGTHFPSNWDPRYTLFRGVSASPDRREDYRVKKDGPRLPAVSSSAGNATDKNFYVNAMDNQDGFVVNGTLPVADDQGVHSLTDVPVFAMGPCQHLFNGVYNSIDIFFGMADCLGLSESQTNKGKNSTSAGGGSGSKSSAHARASIPWGLLLFISLMWGRFEYLF